MNPFQVFQFRFKSFKSFKVKTPGGRQLGRGRAFRAAGAQPLAQEPHGAAAGRPGGANHLKLSLFLPLAILVVKLFFILYLLLFLLI